MKLLTNPNVDHETLK